MQLIDSHCHIDVQELYSQLDHVLTEARKHGVGRIIVPGINASGWQKIQQLSQTYKEIFAAPGLHPLFTSTHSEEDLIQLKQQVTMPGVIAIGEIGLDYYKKDSNKKEQQDLFEKQLDIATENKLPVLLHVRKAHDQVLSIMKNKHFYGGGIAHSFNGSLQQAGKYLDQGFCVAVGSTITYTRATKIRQVIAALPKTALVLETDSPYMPISGQIENINTPKQLQNILQSLAKIRNEEEPTVAKYTTNNCERCLNLPRLKTEGERNKPIR